MNPTPKPPLYPLSVGKAACAACKHQRRRCAPDCPLAPYFPAHRHSDFHNVHRLFGINNVVKLLKKVAPHDRDDAVRSILYEANLRALHPVAGCHGAILELRRQIALCEAELNIVAQKLAFYRDGLMLRNLDDDHDFPLILNNQENVQRFFHDKDQ